MDSNGNQVGEVSGLRGPSTTTRIETHRRDMAGRAPSEPQRSIHDNKD